MLCTSVQYLCPTTVLAVSSSPPFRGVFPLVFDSWITMSLIKQELWLRQNAVTEEEEAYLEGGPVPDLDVIREMQAKQAYYDQQYWMDTAPSYL